MTTGEQEESEYKAKRVRDIEINILVRSSEENLVDLNHLCDNVITSVLSIYEVVLVEKETKILLQHQKTLKSVRLVLQEPPESSSTIPPSLR